MNFIKTKSAILASSFMIPMLCAFADLQVVPPPEKDNSTTTAKASAETANPEKKPINDILRFNGNYSFSGMLISISPEKGLVWQHPDVDKAIEFKLKNIREIILSGGDLPPPASLATIKLTNGDTIKGTIVRLDSDKMILKTWYSDDLKISRKMIKEIYPICVSTAIYEGPGDIKEWNMEGQRGNQKVQVSDKTLIIPGNCSAGRDMKLPDMAKIEFDMDFIPNSNINIFLYSDKVQRHQGDSYILNISQSYLYLQRFSRNESSDNIAQGECRQIMEKRWPHIGILVNKKAKSFTIMVNGAVVQQCNDTRGEFVGKGTIMSFFNCGSISPLKIKNLVVSKWDGRLPDSKLTTEDAAKDNVLFSNDDKITGRLMTIEKGQVTFETDFAPLNVPIERIKNMRMSDGGSQTARKNEKDVRLFFNNDEFLTLAITNLSAGKIKGGSENFGDVEIMLNAFKKIRMNIYDEKESEENSEDTPGNPEGKQDEEVEINE